MKEHAILPQLLKQLRLSSFSQFWQEIANQADDEGWSSARFLAALCEQEIQARTTRRMQVRLKQSSLDLSKTLSSFDFAHVPTLKRPVFENLCADQLWIKQGLNVLIFGPSGVGKTHLANALGISLVEQGCNVLFSRTTHLVQKLQAAKQSLALPSTLNKLDKFDCIILDDFGYVKRDTHETSVLFELISERYERKSIIITCNQPFDEWDKIFTDHVMAVAAIDRLIFNAKIFEMNVESFRKKIALQKKGG